VLVTFKSTASHADVTMFGTAATSLLKMMGQSGNVPGAIMAEDIPAALEKLKAAVLDRGGDGDALASQEKGTSGAGLLAPDGTGHPDVEDDEVEPVTLSTRATPLIGLLEAAHAEGSSVLWEE